MCQRDAGEGSVSAHDRHETSRNVTERYNGILMPSIPTRCSRVRAERREAESQRLITLERLPMSPHVPTSSDHGSLPLSSRIYILYDTVEVWNFLKEIG